MLAICSVIWAFAPEPTATIAMTALTPMMIPSAVKTERILLTLRALNAIRRLAKKVVMNVFSLNGQGSEMNAFDHLPPFRCWNKCSDSIGNIQGSLYPSLRQAGRQSSEHGLLMSTKNFWIESYGLVIPFRISVKYHLFEGFDSGLQGTDPFFKVGKGEFQHRSQFFFHLG